MNHRPDCQLLTVETYGLCTCDFDQRMRLAERFKNADKRVTLADLNKFAIPACTDNK